jgi:hypothetical protein
MPLTTKLESEQAKGMTPIPDPTILTTQQLLREIATAREIVEATVFGIRTALETRLHGMDKAIDLVQNRTDHFPEQIIASFRQLQELHEEKFASIKVQFIERDTRTEQTSRDSKVAVDAALQAAKEAVGEQNKSNALAIAKSEATFTKQIDQIVILIGTMQKGIDDKFDDLKGRVSSVESRQQATEGHKKGSENTLGYVVAVAGLAVAVCSLLVRFH